VLSVTRIDRTLGTQGTVASLALIDTFWYFDVGFHCAFWHQMILTESLLEATLKRMLIQNYPLNHVPLDLHSLFNFFPKWNIWCGEISFLLAISLYLAT
jgi:hypothetical protein